MLMNSAYAGNEETQLKLLQIVRMQLKLVEQKMC